MKKIVIIDNYDSFTYNLVHLLKELGADTTVLRNDCFQPEQLEEYGHLLEVIRRYANRKPILGVCLGEQAIGEVFGARLINLDRVFHGVQTPVFIRDTSDYLFQSLPDTIQAGRYHSWVVSTDDFPACLAITAASAEGYIMALRHRTYDVRGIQFHPESVLTPEGAQIIRNWLEHEPVAGHVTTEQPHIINH